MAIKNILYEGTTDVDLFSRAFEIDMLKNKILELTSDYQSIS